MRMRKMWAIMLSTAMIVTALSTNVMADEVTTVDNEEVVVESVSEEDTISDSNEECLTESIEEAISVATTEEELTSDDETFSEEAVLETDNEEAVTEECGYKINTNLLMNDLISLCSLESISDRNEVWNDFVANSDSLEPWLDYYPCQYAFEAGSTSEARAIANIYGGELIGCSYGIAEMVIPGYTTEQVMSVCVQTAKEDGIGDLLPLIEPNYISYADGERPVDVEAPMSEDEYAQMLEDNWDLYASEGDEEYEEYETEICEDIDEKLLEEYIQSVDGETEAFDYDLTYDENGTVSVISDDDSSEIKAQLVYADTIGWQHAVNGDFEAWNYATGRGVKVAILDSGATKGHRDILYVGMHNAFSVNKGGPGLAYWWGGSWNGPFDNHGHGTHCAGIVAAKGGTKGVVGVAPNAQIISIKCLERYSSDDGAGAHGSEASIARAVNMAVAKGASVISMSIGGVYGILEEKAVKDAISKGAIVVCAAGNEKSSAPSYPAQYPGTIAVSATRQSGSTQVFDDSYSNYGNGSSSKIDFAAPGSNVYSTYLANGYDTMSGTSMACPMVAGAIALYLEKNPELKAIKNNTRSKRVIDALKATATDLGTSGYDNYYGYGAINTAKLVGMYSESEKAFNLTAIPKVSVISGPVSGGYGVKLYSSNGANSIYYTLDGSEPTESSLKYGTERDANGLIYLPENAGTINLKAASINPDGTKTKTLIATYNMVPKTIAIEGKDYRNTEYLGKAGFFKDYSAISSYTTGKLMPYQMYTLSLAKSDQVTIEVKTANFNAELFLLNGTSVVAKDVRNIYGSDVGTKYIRKIVYKNTSTSTQNLNLIVTSGALLANQSLGIGTAKYTLSAKTEKAVTGLNLSVPQTIAVKGKTIKANASVLPFDAANDKVIWKLLSNGYEVPSTLATVNAGTVKIVGDVGTATQLTLEATAEGNTSAKKTATITVYPTIKNLSAINSIVNLSVNGTNNQYAAMGNILVIPNNTYGYYTYSSSNTKVATISSDGLIKAVSPGKSTITVKALDGSGKSKAFTVNVTKFVTGITATLKSGSQKISSYYPISQGASDAIVTNVAPLDASNKKLSYSLSSGSPVGVICNNGVVKVDAGVPVGTTFTVTATAIDGSGKSISVPFKVYGKASKVVLNSSDVKLDTVSNNKLQLKASVQDVQGQTMGIAQNVVWSSNNTKTAVVDASGNITAVGKGTATIKAVASGGNSVSAICKVNVVSAVTSINITVAKTEIRNSNVPVIAGKNTNLVAEVYPADANNKSVEWQLIDAPAGVTITKSSLHVPAGTIGTVKVKSTALDGYGATCTATLKIYSAAATKVYITGGDTELNTYNKKSTKFVATPVPGAGGGGMANVVWSSSNTKVATVDSLGNVTAVGKGTASITAMVSDGSGVKASTNVKVSEPITNMIIKNASGAMTSSGNLLLITGSNKLVASVISPNAPSDKTIIWSIYGAPSGVTIDAKSGSVTVKKGFTYPVTGVRVRATVKATGVSFEQYVDIYPATTRVLLSKNDKSFGLAIGTSRDLSPSSISTYSYNGTGKLYIYSSSNPNVATVSSSGKVTGVGKGTATITVMAIDGTKKKITAKVKVY